MPALPHGFSWWRRGDRPLLWRFGRLAVLRLHQRRKRIGYRRRLCGELRYCRQYFPAVPEQDADVLEILIGKMGKDRDVDAVLRKCVGVLGQAEPRSLSE
jgi:hypothetical protein